MLLAPVKRVQLGPISTLALFVSVFHNQVRKDMQRCWLKAGSTKLYGGKESPNGT